MQHNINYRAWERIMIEQIIKIFNWSTRVCHDCKISWDFPGPCPQCGKAGEYA